MIDYNEVLDEIARLERDKTTYTNCEKLSILYSIMDHRENPVEDRTTHEPAGTRMYSFAPAPSSEFLLAMNGADPDEALQILDEHFECVKVLHPKEYAAVIRKINGTK